jgi:hypothetical protein
MKSNGSKSTRNKDLNSSKLSIDVTNDLEIRIKTLEEIVNKCII